ncbi:sulfotransferase family protein [Roseivivax marinus]|uniref:sulfotransferase family protein n=1 Tax=Roseivivax marinus TaxID=1379903 RepID=UPI00138E41A8|nr:sulfotransferase family protein [Roseivivax marinus]
MPESAAQQRIALLVLGMHRSGTSVLSGVLSRLDCVMPATPIGAEPENPKGFYESRLVARLNDAILSSSDSAWTDWTAFSKDWYEGRGYERYLPKAVSLIETEFGGGSPIVLKDPRICRLVPFWLAALDRAGYAVRIVLTHRSSEEVRQSLSRRNNIDPAYGRLLWLRHVLDAEYDSRGLSRTFVGYDRLLSDWRREISRVTEGIDPAPFQEMAETGKEIDDFVAPALRHFRSSPMRPEGWFGLAEDILDRWAKTGEDPADHAVLDDIREALDTATPAFDPLIRHVAGAPTEVREKADRHGAAIEELEQETASLRKEIANRSEKLLAAEHKLRVRHHELALLAKRQIEIAEDLSEAEAACHDAKERVSEMAEVEARASEMAEAEARASAMAEMRRRMACLGVKYTGLKIIWLWKHQRTLRRSNIFDAEHYLEQNPDVRSLGMNPARHYLLYGCAEGRDPGPDFSTLGYYRHNPDVLALGMNAALHYIRYGRSEDRSF